MEISMENVKVGFLPLYVKLYDDYIGIIRPQIEAYRDDICNALNNTGIELVQADICRTASEFAAAVNLFEAEKVDAIITVHMAYSPSLECIDALSSTKLPILILDTTRDFNFGFNVVEGGISFNHGIHGVQDMCNLLRRRGKDYSLFAGHFAESDVIERVADAARAIKAATFMKGIKVGQLGGSFAGMGDFLAGEDAMERLGVQTVICKGDELAAFRDSVTEEEIKAEYEYDCAENGASAVEY